MSLSFLTLKIITSSTQLLVILENFDVQKKCKGWTYIQISKIKMKAIGTILTLNFDSQILLHIFPDIKSQNLNFSKFSSKFCHFTSCQFLLQYYSKFSTKSSDFFFKACICYFFIFSPNDRPSKTMKNVFYFI